jgi:hypothetical protein
LRAARCGGENLPGAISFAPVERERFRSSSAMTDRRWSGLFAASGLARYLGKVLADGDRIVVIVDILDKTYGKGVPEGAQKLKSLQPHAPSRRPCF